jgi:hypothetical protein
MPVAPALTIDIPSGLCLRKVYRVGVSATLFLFQSDW